MSNPVDFTVPLACDGLRLDVALARCFPEMSRTQIQRACEGGLILCNGLSLAAKTKVKSGQSISVQWVEREEITVRPRPMYLEILYEDEVMLAVNKPSGEVVHPAPHVKDSFIEAILAHTNGQLAKAAGIARPGVVHRLDKETSGVIIFAKTDLAYYSLSQMFMNRSVKKYYEALVYGKMRVQSGSIREPIGRDSHHRTRMAIRRNGRPAHTDWECFRIFSPPGISQLALRLHTGRTHQIRVHLASMGHPILGDGLYGFQTDRFPELQIPRILLHAKRIELKHPLTGSQLSIRAPLPTDMENFVASLISAEGECPRAAWI
ncbi:MAG: RluA family pseudouridine synthase [Puniceicoccales bacterium]|jgi:23S rRNA pseudouridine1911/1915/1917 synthase|nr:RluA family pseudouridine synthase [Puniceicoccales bacterium]